ncbi:phospholipase B1, membrane-associated-like [Antedon mediterranea]|uniref:phospholipase B1, membrane-associated-like n=1 Tax=Antedon mediterranea TaxID=105859 RepID=UPI003AF80E02
MCRTIYVFFLIFIVFNNVIQCRDTSHQDEKNYTGDSSFESKSIDATNEDSDYWKDGTLEKVLYTYDTEDAPKCHTPRAKGNVLPSGEFNCPVVHSREVPTSVHRLRPGDIKVIGAIGDSITAANGALSETLPGVLLQYRGVSWSMGGDGNLEEYQTLTNILRKYNPDIHGYSVGIARTDALGSNLNSAVPGAKAVGMENQALNLVEKMKIDPNVDFENDWKLVTLFIGGNDLCQSCKKPEERTAELYVANIEKALKIFHDELPRTFVNVVGILNVEIIRELRTPICTALHVTLECPCPLGSQLRLEKVVHLTKQYQAFLQSAVDSGKYDDKEDFTVAYQPMFHDTDIPRLEDGSPDFSYFAPDCFHFSGIGHAAAAIALWNNMFQRVGSKDTVWKYQSINCPSEDFPYLYTNVNSAPEFQVNEKNNLQQKQQKKDNYKTQLQREDIDVMGWNAEDDSTKESLSKGSIVSIALGVILLVGLCVIVVVVIKRKKLIGRKGYVKV